MTKQILAEMICQSFAALRRFLTERWRWLVFGTVLALLTGALIYAGYRLPWTGFGQHTGAVPDENRAKTLWDWLELLLVPLLLATGAWLLNRAVREREHRTELDRSHQASLQAYLDRVSALLRDQWRESGEGFLEANIIRAQTLTVLRQLDRERKALLLQFLYESGLIGKWPERALVDLSEADLRGAELRGAKLSGIDLRGAYLSWANLISADLSKAELRGTYLSRANLIRADLSSASLKQASLGGADLGGADLNGADLSEANLRGASVTNEQLAQATSLEGAILPDGTVLEREK